MSRIRITEDNCDAIMDERRDDEFTGVAAEDVASHVEADYAADVRNGDAAPRAKYALTSGRLKPRSAK